MINLFNQRFLTLNFHLFVLVMWVYALAIEDTGCWSALQYAVVLSNSVLKIWIKLSLPGHLCRECCRDWVGWGISEPSLIFRSEKVAVMIPSPKSAMHSYELNAFLLPEDKSLAGPRLDILAEGACSQLEHSTSAGSGEESLIFMPYLLCSSASSDQSRALEHGDVLCAFKLCWEKWGRLRPVIQISQQLGSGMLWCSWLLVQFCRLLSCHLFCPEQLLDKPMRNQ